MQKLVAVASLECSPNRLKELQCRLLVRSLDRICLLGDHRQQHSLSNRILHRKPAEETEIEVLGLVSII